MQIGRLRGIKFSYSTGDTSFRGEQEQPEIPIGEEEVVVGWWWDGGDWYTALSAGTLCGVSFDMNSISLQPISMPRV